MMIHDDALDPELRALADAERDSPGAPPRAKGRVRRRLGLEPSGGGGGGSARAMRWSHVHTAAAALAFVAGGVLGGVAVGLRAPNTQIVYVERAPPSATALAPASDAPVLPAASIAEPAATASARAPRPRAVATLSDSLSAEQALLDTARAALVRGDAAEALATAERHRLRFPAGKLAEEREAIAIRALLRLDRAEEARARARRFEASYPGSALQPAIDQAVEAK